MAYNGNDAPAGAYLARLDPGVTSVVATIDLGANLAPGTYLVFVKVLDYDFGGRVTVALGGSTGTVTANDRDVNRYWTTPVRAVLSNSARQLNLSFIKTQPAATVTRCLLLGLCLTTNSSVFVTKDDALISYIYPEPAAYDNSPSVKGNLIPDGSFEAGWGHGWGLGRIGREEQLRDLWTTNESFHGSACLRLPASPSPGFSFISRPYHLAPNKKYTLSAYVKSPSGRNWASMWLRNAIVPPSGLGFTNQQELSTSILADSTWRRISLTGYLLKYPESDFHITLGAQGYDGGSVLVDGIQLEEGDQAPFAPRTRLELGLISPNPGNLFHEDETVRITARVRNHLPVSVATNVQFEVFNYLNERVAAGTDLVSLASGSTVDVPLSMNTGKRGIFRVNAWITDAAGTEDELVCSVLPRPSSTGLDLASSIGMHIDYYPWQLALMQKAGVKWTRGLSTGQYWRWLNVEPTEGSFVWFDELVSLPARYGISIMANLGENAPTWAYRTYFGLTNLNGSGFTIGETVRSATGAGVITLVLNQTSATGPALQLNGVTGTFAQGITLTGTVSRTTATLRTPAYPESVALDKWENYVQTVVTHYRTSVSAWEVWNEPDQDGQEVPQPNGDNGFYAEILRRAALKIRAIAPSATIVGMGGVSHPAWIRQVMDHLGPPATNLVDAMAVHLYPPNGVMGEALKTQSIDVYGKPLWNTETGAWDLGFYSGVNANHIVSGKSMLPFRNANRFYLGHYGVAEKVVPNFLQTIGYGLSKYFYYDARQASKPDFHNVHPTLLEYDDSLKTKGVVYAILAHLFDHARGLGRLSFPFPATEAFLFERSGQALVGIWSTDTREKDIQLSGLPPGSISVLDLMGNPIAMAELKFRYGRIPVFVIGTNVNTTLLYTAFSTASVAEVPDLIPPALTITAAPRGSVKPDQLVRLRWLAIDNVSLPDEVDPVALQYSWQLEGADDTWSAWTADTYVDYPNLAPARYVFRVKAKDKAGNISAEQIRSFAVAPRSPLNVKATQGP